MWLSTPRADRCVSAKGASDAANEIGYPIALKMMSPHLAHKTEAGAVALGVADADALQAALNDMKMKVSEHDACAVTDRFLIESMSPSPVAELIVTLRSDPQFGSALVLGSGGILTELVGDAVTLLLPATATDIAVALRSLRVARLLDGFRGRSKVDVEAVALALHQLCAAFIQERGTIAELEINPMFVYEDHIVAVDALIHVAAP